ncbi:MAG TPA: hypothetical protein VF396_17385 [Bradyrhizobium sp.]|jgi:hypothetical protein
MKLLMALLVGAVAGIVPALAQTSPSTSAHPPDGSRSDRPSSDLSDRSLPTPTASDPATTVTYRGTGSGYQPMGSGGYNPMGHK